jgi:hypothetical protein
MSYAFYYDVPGNEHSYRLITDTIGDARPDGLVASIVTKIDGGLRHLNVWQSREQWTRFRDRRAQPAVTAVLTGLGIPVPGQLPEEHELDIVDVGP